MVLLAGCSVAPQKPVTPAPVVQAPADNAEALHKSWENGYAAGFAAATRLSDRRLEQNHDEVGNLPANAAPNDLAVPASLPPAAPPSAATPVTALPALNAYQPTGPATPLN